MAPIQRRRFVDTSEGQEQLELNVSDEGETVVSEQNSEATESTETATAEPIEEDPAKIGVVGETSERIPPHRERVVVRRTVRRTPSSRNSTDTEHTPRGRSKSSGTRGSYSRTQVSSSERVNIPMMDNEEVTSNVAAEDSNNDSKPRLLINDLTSMGMHDLRNMAGQYGIPNEDLAPMKKQELIFVILKSF